MSIKTVLTALADAIRSKSGRSGAMTLEQMTEAVSGIQLGGIDTTLPEAEAATASDVLEGKSAWVNGNKITGTVSERTGILDFQIDDSKTSFKSGSLYATTFPFASDRFVRKGASVNVRFSELAVFGDATAADVAAGKTFTSKAGLKLTGTHECEVVPEVAQATPSISVSAGGLITASATQEAGKVAYGTKSATHQLTTQAAQTITPGTADKTIPSGKYLTGTQTIKGDANLIPGNIKSGVSIFGVAGTLAASASGNALAVRDGTATTASFDTGLSDIVAILINKNSVSSKGMVNASVLVPNDSVKITGCSSYSAYVKSYGFYGSTVSAGNYLTINGGIVEWVSTDSTTAFIEGDTYKWEAIGCE